MWQKTVTQEMTLLLHKFGRELNIFAIAKPTGLLDVEVLAAILANKIRELGLRKKIFKKTTQDSL
jgi:hypothetical protein